ncbi:MAG: hypothetical protein ACP5NF_02425 [Thermoanaerobaculum sp.]
MAVLRSHHREGRLFFGECLAGSLKPASYVFRDVLGGVAFRVDQISPWRLWHFTKIRGALALELGLLETKSGEEFAARRRGPFWKPRWEVLDPGGTILFSYVPASFWGTSLTVTAAQTGEVAAARVPNPLLVWRQRALLSGLDGGDLANMSWSEYSLSLGCHRRVRVEVFEASWELAAIALAAIRWSALQQR